MRVKIIMDSGKEYTGKLNTTGNVEEAEFRNSLGKELYNNNGDMKHDFIILDNAIDNFSVVHNKVLIIPCHISSIEVFD